MEDVIQTQIKLPTEILFVILKYFIKGIEKPNNEEQIKTNIQKIRLVCSLWNQICIDPFFKNNINYFINFKFNENITINTMKYNYNNIYSWKDKIICSYEKKICIYVEDIIFLNVYNYTFVNPIKVKFINNLLFIIESGQISVLNLDLKLTKETDVLSKFYTFIDSNKIRKFLQFDDINPNLFSTIGDNHIKLWKYDNDINEFDKYLIKIDDYINSIVDSIEVKNTFVRYNYIMYRANNIFIILDINNDFSMKYITDCNEIFSYENYFLILYEEKLKLIKINDINNTNNVNSNQIIQLITIIDKWKHSINWFIVKQNKLIILTNKPVNTENNLENDEDERNILIKKKIYFIEFNNTKKINSILLGTNDFNIINEIDKDTNYYINGNYIYYLVESGIYYININNYQHNYIKYPLNVEIFLYWNSYIFLSNNKNIHIYTLFNNKLILIKSLNLLLKNNENIEKFYINDNKIIIHTNNNIIIYRK